MLDADGSGIVSSMEIGDQAMKDQQKLWVNRLMNIKNFVAGLLAGLCLCEVIILISMTSMDDMVGNPVAFTFNWITGI